MSKHAAKPLVVKTTVNLPRTTLEAAKAAAAKRNASISDVVRGALNLQAIIADATQSGEKVLLQSPDKSVREIIIVE